VHGAVDELEPLAARRGITLSCDLAAALPAIHADRSRIARVFSNLGVNAIRFTPPGGCITFTATLAADAVCFQVTDTGSGIAPQNLPYVFDRFWRANPAASDGAGLGLAIAKWIVEAHLGKIWVESYPGSGSTFYFTVPLAHRGLRLTPLHGSDM
jgi:signal transduction histidine kinase